MTNGNGSALCASVQVFGGVRGYEQDGVAFLHIEDVARGLGFTTTTEKGGVEYTNVRWSRVEECLQDLNFLPQVAESGNPHDYYVPENIFYRLCMKARNEVAEAFQAKVADEIIPSIRKTGGYSMTPTDYVAALRALADEVGAKQNAQRALEAEIVAHEADMKEARRTKAHFIEGRDAEMCGRVGGLTKENERLRTEIGDSRNWKQVKAIKWLGDYFALSKGLFGAIAYKLKGICDELDLPRRDIEDSQYGTVKIYHVKAIEELHGRIDRDPNYLSKYRKVA
jgi:prophage antirepressor-like protein